jgi:toxin YoeB
MKTEELNRHPAAPSKPCKGQKLQRELVFEPEFLEDLEYWVNTDKKTSVRVLLFIQEIGRTPFEGTGKPERLRHYDGNTWSRRINKSDRLTYRITDTGIYFLECRSHYKDH